MINKNFNLNIGLVHLCLKKNTVRTTWIFLKQQNLHSKNNQASENFFSETTSFADSIQAEADSMETDYVTIDSTETETKNTINVLEEDESGFDNMFEIGKRYIEVLPQLLK
jgi:hypothetical protein